MKYRTNYASILVTLALALSTGQQATAVDPTWWSHSVVTQIVPPGGHPTTVPVSFSISEEISDVRIGLLAVHPPAAGKPKLLVEPTEFELIKAEEEYNFKITFPALEGVMSDTYTWVLYLHQCYNCMSEGPHLSSIGSALLVTLEIDPSVPHGFSGLATALRENRISEAVSLLSPSDRKRADRQLSDLDEEARIRLAGDLESARLIYATNDMQVYEGSWTLPDGTKTEVDFTYARDPQVEQGKWLVHNLY